MTREQSIAKAILAIESLRAEFGGALRVHQSASSSRDARVWQIIFGTPGLPLPTILDQACVIADHSHDIFMGAPVRGGNTTSNRVYLRFKRGDIWVRTITIHGKLSRLLTPYLQLISNSSSSSSPQPHQP